VNRDCRRVKWCPCTLDYDDDDDDDDDDTSDDMSKLLVVSDVQSVSDSTRVLLFYVSAYCLLADYRHSKDWKSLM